MPIFKKEILPIGTYSVHTSEGFKQKKFTTKELKALAATANKMINEGTEIPAPFDHTPEAVPVNLSANAAPSYNNAGYWKKFWVSDEAGKATLYGELDAPGDEKDLNTPAGKVGKTVKEVSIGARSVYVDGSGKEWKNAILHVALCTHPRVKNQSNFELTASDNIVCMSYMDDPDAPSNQNLSDLISKLKKVCGICIPGGTSLSTLANNLSIALDQIAELKGDDDDPEKVEPAPVYLSTPTEVDMKLSPEQVAAIVKGGQINPATNKSFTYEDFQMSAPTEKKEPAKQEVPEEVQLALATSRAIAHSFLGEKKKSLSQRVDALVASGRVPKEFADTQLVPQVSGYQLSFSNGEVAKAPVETVIEALEMTPAKETAPSAGYQMSGFLPGTVIQNPPSNPVEMKDEDYDNAAKALLASL